MNLKDELNRKQAILAGIPYTITKQFPWKLHEMLEAAEKDNHEDIVSWLPSGMSFKVHTTMLYYDILTAGLLLTTILTTNKTPNRSIGPMPSSRRLCAITLDR